MDSGLNQITAYSLHADCLMVQNVGVEPLFLLPKQVCFRYITFCIIKIYLLVLRYPLFLLVLFQPQMPRLFKERMIDF